MAGREFLGSFSARYDSSSSKILPAQAGEEAPVGFDDGVGEVALGLLEFQDLLFYGVAGDQAAGEDGAGLADAVGAIDGLGFNGRFHQESSR